MFSIDINCDMGEGTGNDEQLMPFISSANIACGYHAGDEHTMQQTIDGCLKYNVAIGAHPSFADKENFGRREMNLSQEEVYKLVTAQVNSLSELAKSRGARLHHVKPHGALYNMAAQDSKLAMSIANAVKDIDPSLIVYGLAGSCSITEAIKAGLKTGSEVFADRTYQDDGSLTPRKQTNAIIDNRDNAIAQVLQMIKDKTVTALSGKIISIGAETICIHGDGEHAVEFAKAIYHQLIKEGIDINAI
jgi:5-oxoprolinase (ATP-hydrolysing) subunit A